MREAVRVRGEKVQRGKVGEAGTSGTMVRREWRVAAIGCRSRRRRDESNMMRTGRLISSVTWNFFTFEHQTHTKLLQ